MWTEKTDIKLLDKLIKIGMKGPDNQPEYYNFGVHGLLLTLEERGTDGYALWDP